MTDAVIRPIRLVDAGEVIRLLAIMYESMGLDSSKPAWRDQAKKMIQERAGAEDCAVFVAEEDNQVVACGGVTVSTRLPGPGAPNGRFAYIQWMVTDPQHRRRGHARAIFEVILDWIRQRDISILELHATPQGDELYRSYGFEEPRNPQLRRSAQDPAPSRRP
jgi:GNAT superfamily N-acetyltransferase